MKERGSEMNSQNREFTFSLTYASGGTEALIIEAANEAQARELIANIYPGAVINWIL
jgi:hypothetical protein